MFQELLSNKVLKVCMGLSFTGFISFFYRMKIKNSGRTCLDLFRMSGWRGKQCLSKETENMKHVLFILVN